MTRLTNQIRIDVIHKILNKTFEKRLRQIESEESYLAFEARDCWLGDDRDAFLSLNPKLQTSDIHIHVDPKRDGKTYDRYGLVFHPKARISTHGCTPSGSSLMIGYSGQEPVGGDRYKQLDKSNMTDEFRMKIIAHIEKVEKLHDDVRKLHSKIAEQLRICTTVKKLNELWPEAVTYVPKQDNPIAVVIDRDGVNSLISCMKDGDCSGELTTTAEGS